MGKTALPAMHPGELLREDVLPALGKPISELEHESSFLNRLGIPKGSRV